MLFLLYTAAVKKCAYDLNGKPVRVDWFLVAVVTVVEKSVFRLPCEIVIARNR